MPIWVSVGGFETDDYAEICSRLDDHAGVSAIELNVSCPNVEAPAESAAQIVAASRLATRKPLWAKLSPAVPDIAEVARAAQAAGADGLSLVNTIRGLKLDARTLRPVLGPGQGGLSGPALKPIALAAVANCYRATQLPIVGMGGVQSGLDALELVGAAGLRALAGDLPECLCRLDELTGRTIAVRAATLLFWPKAERPPMDGGFFCSGARTFRVAYSFRIHRSIGF